MVFLVLWLSASILLAVVWALVGWRLGERGFSRRGRRRRKVAVTRSVEPVGASEAGDPALASMPRPDGAPAE